MFRIFCVRFILRITFFFWLNTSFDLHLLSIWPALQLSLSLASFSHCCRDSFAVEVFFLSLRQIFARREIPNNLHSKSTFFVIYCNRLFLILCFIFSLTLFCSSSYDTPLK
jgi:hypothetical protein